MDIISNVAFMLFGMLLAGIAWAVTEEFRRGQPTKEIQVSLSSKESASAKKTVPLSELLVETPQVQQIKKELVSRRKKNNRPSPLWQPTGKLVAVRGKSQDTDGYDWNNVQELHG